MNDGESMKKITKMLFVFVVIAILAIAGCTEKTNAAASSSANKTSNVSLSNISDIIPQYAKLAAKATVTPVNTPTQNKNKNETIKSKGAINVRVYDLEKNDYLVEIVCIQKTNKSWGNISRYEVSDPTGNYIFQSWSRITIYFEDKIHALLIKKGTAELTLGEPTIIEVRQNCSQELLESAR